ncbi:MAG: transposase [Candidatus Korobacteraceae bacterium]
MPRGLERYHEARDLHFITFSCYHRQPLLTPVLTKNLFELALEKSRVRYDFFVTGYVVMPEHVHLLISEPEGGTLASAVQSIKQSLSRRISTPSGHFWQARYYDFNVYTPGKRVEKLRYIHRNPVKRGLVDRPEDWPWSSFRHYTTGERGIVEIESWWTATARERTGIVPGFASATARPRPKDGLERGTQTF